MFGIVVGTVCLVGLIGLAKGSRRGCHGRGFDRRSEGGSRGGRGRRRSGRMTRAVGEMFKRKLDLDEDQEDIVDLAFKDLHAALKDFGEVMKDSRGDVVDAFRGEVVDDGGLEAVFARQDEEVSRARRQLVSAFKQVHAVLEPDQREAAAEWLASQPKWS